MRWNNVTDCGIYFCANPVNCGTHQLVGEEGGEVKPNPIKAFLRLSDLFNILFSQAQEIKRLRAENAAKDAIILKITRHAEGITKAWNDGVLSLNEIKK